MIDFNKYETLAKDLTGTTNSLWNTVTFITVADVLAKELDLRALDKTCWNLKDRISSARRAFNKELDAMSAEQYDEIYEEHDKVYNILTTIDQKLDAVDMVISKLREIENKIEEDEIDKLFGDITTINLGESIIRFDRL